jgi:aminoglycoside phosphotransferase
MATLTILKAIITQIKDVRKVINLDEGSVGDSHYDLSRAIWNIETVVRRMKHRRL